MDHALEWELDTSGAQVVNVLVLVLEEGHDSSKWEKKLTGSSPSSLSLSPSTFESSFLAFLKAAAFDLAVVLFLESWYLLESVYGTIDLVVVGFFGPATSLLAPFGCGRRAVRPLPPP